jgi:flagellar hook-associated protein 3 FlgL
VLNLDPASELFLADLGRIQQRIAEASRQVSSGKRIAAPSDAPDQIDSLLQLRAARQRNTQIQSNLVLAGADADAAGNALASSIKLMDRALVLAAQGANFTQTTAVRQSLAEEVQSLQEQMVAFSLTTVPGRYIFSGDDSGTPPYSFDLASPNAVVQLTSAGATTRLEDPAGGSIAATRSAQEIFDNRNADGTDAADNVFAALNNLRLALLSDDPAAVSAAIEPIKRASIHLNSMEAFYGSVQSRVSDAVYFANSYDIRLQTEIADKEDADIAAAALELANGKNQLDAALQMRAALPRSSLFDFLG